MDTWECRICGYKFEGDQPPAKCPLCDAPDTDFVRITSRIKPVRFARVDRPQTSQGTDLLQKFVEASLSRREEARRTIRHTQESAAADTQYERSTPDSSRTAPGSGSSLRMPDAENAPLDDMTNPVPEQSGMARSSIQDSLHPDVTRDTADELVLAFDLLTVAEGLMRTEWMEHAAALREIAMRYLSDIASRRCDELSQKNVSPLGLLPYLFSDDRAPKQLKLYLRRIIEEIGISSESTHPSGDSGT